MKNKKLHFFHVALMYVGAIMGAGFASGREAWQFFGVFAEDGYVGLILAGILFLVLGMMVSYIAINLKTIDMGKIIVPFENKVATDAVGYLMAAILYTIIISMSAAGGSFLSQQFGFNKAIGGGIIVIAVIFTVLGDFQRISKVFRFIMPALFSVVVLVCIMVIFSDIEQSDPNVKIAPSGMASTWFIAAFIYISYNVLGMIPMVAKASLSAKNQRHGVFGAGLGGVLLAILGVVLVLALQKDMAFSNTMDLPMLGYSARISKFINLLYGVVLFFAIYSAATSTYYGFSTKVKDSPRKKYILIIGATIGFICGLAGFKNIVAYLYPIEGYIGFAIMGLITVNFFRVYKMKKNEEKIRKDYSSDIYVDYPGHSRFDYPDKIKRVTSGFGGESLLIFGENKTALYDCGMAYCHEGTVKNIERELEKNNVNKLDYILLSHTHYDHIGALPYILKRWPKALVCGSQKAKQVFESLGAKKTMKRLGEAARDTFLPSDESILVEPLRVDIVVKDKDKILLGDKYFVVLETKGHTDCSLTYVLEPKSIMFTSESTGVLRNPEYMNTAFLKSYKDTIASAAKCKAYRPKQLIAAHYGILPEGITDQFFDLYVKFAEDEKDFILGCRSKGMNKEEIFKAFEEKYWSELRSRAQPKAAFDENAKYSISHILENF